VALAKLNKSIKGIQDKFKGELEGQLDIIKRKDE